MDRRGIKDGHADILLFDQQRDLCAPKNNALDPLFIYKAIDNMDVFLF